MGDMKEEGRGKTEVVVSPFIMYHSLQNGKEGSLLGPGSHLTCPTPEVSRGTLVMMSQSVNLQLKAYLVPTNLPPENVSFPRIRSRESDQAERKLVRDSGGKQERGRGEVRRVENLP